MFNINNRLYHPLFFLFQTLWRDINIKRNLPTKKWCLLLFEPNISKNNGYGSESSVYDYPNITFLIYGRGTYKEHIWKEIKTRYLICPLSKSIVMVTRRLKNHKYFYFKWIEWQTHLRKQDYKLNKELRFFEVGLLFFALPLKPTPGYLTIPIVSARLCPKKRNIMLPAKKN